MPYLQSGVYSSTNSSSNSRVSQSLPAFGLSTTSILNLGILVLEIGYSMDRRPTFLLKADFQLHHILRCLSLVDLTISMAVCLCPGALTLDAAIRRAIERLLRHCTPLLG